MEQVVSKGRSTGVAEFIDRGRPLLTPARQKLTSRVL
jgi:hypothetical protein